MIKTIQIITLFIFYLRVCQAQLGPTIISPLSNDTVYPGQTTTIQFQYQNIGTGDYIIDIDLWQDPSGKELINNVVSNYKVPPGNSSGAYVAFKKNATFDWHVQHGLNFTFYLTVTERSQTRISQNLTLRSFPLMLHTAGALHLLPNLFVILFFSMGLIFIL
ncbi:hypothetical protein BJ944DRAFT_274152 [Cunninghamella echinulata]|nr:hypothetical protein BJ944DRAFT_274152 [Cunninghamella echinulata]